MEHLSYKSNTKFITNAGSGVFIDGDGNFKFGDSDEVM